MKPTWVVCIKQVPREPVFKRTGDALQIDRDKTEVVYKDRIKYRTKVVYKDRIVYKTKVVYKDRIKYRTKVVYKDRIKYRTKVVYKNRIVYKNRVVFKPRRCKCRRRGNRQTHALQ